MKNEISVIAKTNLVGVAGEAKLSGAETGFGRN